MKYLYFSFILVLLSLAATGIYSQKLSDRLKADLVRLPASAPTHFSIKVRQVDAFDSLVRQHAGEIRIESTSLAFKIFNVECTLSFVQKYLLENANVQFIENGDRRPKTESLLTGYDNSLNTLNKVQAVFPELNGRGLVVSIKEDMFDSTDPDLKGRTEPTTVNSNIISSHANDMATIIAGGGNTFPTDRGAAWGATITSANFINLLPDMAAYAQFHISVQNHSYGTAIENYYGSDAAAYDSSMLAFPGLVHVFSSGNSGDSASPTGVYSGIPGYANLTGSFKMAKNTITVGSTDSLGNISPLSSKGPAYDGRVKPELVAFGVAGSSEASAVGSGTALLMQSAYGQANPGKLPDNSLLKAILINSANDVGSKGIDFSSGYGSIAAGRSVKNMLAGNYFAGSVGQNATATFNLQIPTNARNLKITLVWNDVPAEPLAPKSLINDLDLSLSALASGQHWLPWVLNSYPQLDSIQQAPVRARDSLNVVEQITVDTPASGNYMIGVKGYSVKTPTQAFYVAYQWDTAGTFSWSYPTKADYPEIGGMSIFRWQSEYGNTATGQLEYSIDGGTTWKLIDAAAPLSPKYYQWVAPSTFATGMARMTINGEIFQTDTFSFSSPLNIKVGFDCADSILLSWHKLAGIDSFHVFSLTGDYLTQIAAVKDTAVVLAKSKTGYPYYAISPVLPFHTDGVKSFTINASLQGVGCYIRSFLADLQTPANTAKLSLLLGSDYNISRIHFEKLLSSGWKTLAILQPIGNQFSYTTDDDSLMVGANTYRVRLELLNGNIYSDPVSIYISGNSDYLVFPNPTFNRQALEILSKNLSAPYTAMIYDILGRPVLRQPVNNVLQYIPIQNLAPGTYVLVLQNNKGILYREKIVIR